MRTDKPPFNDKRVRQALCMAIDRKARQERDQQRRGRERPVLLDHVPEAVRHARKWRTWARRRSTGTSTCRRRSNCSARPASTRPSRRQMSHYDASLIGQPFPDTATLVQAQWKQAGVANVKDIAADRCAQFVATTSLGNYEGMALPSSRPMSGVGRGLQVKNYSYWGPNGRALRAQRRLCQRCRPESA